MAIVDTLKGEDMSRLIVGFLLVFSCFLAFLRGLRKMDVKKKLLYCASASHGVLRIRTRLKAHQCKFSRERKKVTAEAIYGIFSQLTCQLHIRRGGARGKKYEQSHGLSAVFEHSGRGI